MTLAIRHAASAKRPHWTTVNPLFNAVVGANAVNTKAACLIAAQVEEDLICRSWPTGTIYGSEGQLAARFGVCRVVMREAVRILESRGTARMRRGPNGGLLVMAPTMSMVLESIHRYVVFHRGEMVQGSSCKAILQSVYASLTSTRQTAEVGPALIEFVEILIDAVLRYSREGAVGRVPLGAAAESARSRAEQILRLLIKDLDGGRQADRRLGSELDLCDRYGADRNALRQAVRILEFEGIAVSTAGRGKGLMTRVPEPNALCRLINCHFIAAGVTPSDAMHLFKLMSVEAVSIAARTATKADLARLRASMRTLDRCQDGVTSKVMQDVEQSQFGIIGEPLLDILLRCVKSYSTWWSAIRNPESEVLGATYRIETQNVISAILARDAIAAAAAQAAKVDRLNMLI